MEKASNASSELRSLIDLQDFNSRIKVLRGEASMVPVEIALLKSDLEKSRANLEEARSHLDTHEKSRRKWEGEVERLRERLSKYKSQLMEVKTNREYQAVLHEIALAEEEIARLEDRVLEAMLDADENLGAVRLAEAEVDRKSEEFDLRVKELESSAKKAEEEIEMLEVQRSELLRSLSPELRDMYERIAAARAGIAMAEARNQSCQVCHVKLRPQLFNEIKSNQRIITCENCNRILYYVEI